MIKIQLHFHTNKDPLDTFIDYDPYKAIDQACEYGYNVISFTHHRKFIFDISWVLYAWKRKVLIVPGVEYEIFWKHVLVYNPTEDIHKVKTFEQLREYKASYPFVKVVAPHPFYPGKFCLRNYLLKYKDIFDGVEYSSYYARFFWKKYNEKAIKFAVKYWKKIIWTSDVHNLRNIDDTFSLVSYRINFKNDYNKEVENFLKKLFDKKTQIYIHTQPYSIYKLFSYNMFFLKWWIKRYIRF